MSKVTRSGKERQKPNFLVIGAQKSGTTWLYYYLREHPDVFVPYEKKELAFFDEKRNFEKMEFDGYCAYFKGVQNERAIGEVTPGYLWCSNSHPEWGALPPFREGIPRRVLSYLGNDLKIIVLLRNPVDRAISAFLHHKAKGRFAPDCCFSEAVKEHGIAHMGFYFAHLSKWLDIFEEKAFFITTYERFFADSASHKAVQQFLRIPVVDQAEKLGDRIHVGTGFTRNNSGAFDSNSEMVATKEQIDALRLAYFDDVGKLRRILNLDTSSWRSDFGKV